MGNEDQRYPQWFTGQLSASTWSGGDNKSSEPIDVNDDAGSCWSGSQNLFATSCDSQNLRATSRDNRDIRNRRFGQESLRYQQLFTREQPQWPQWEDGDTEECEACTRLREDVVTAPKKALSPWGVETTEEPLAAVFAALSPLDHKLPSYQKKARGEATASKLETSPPAAALDLGLTLDLREIDEFVPQSDAEGNGNSADGGNCGQSLRDSLEGTRQVGPKEELCEEALIEREFEEYEQESRPATTRGSTPQQQKLGDSAEGWDFEDDDGRP